MNISQRRNVTTNPNVTLWRTFLIVAMWRPFPYVAFWWTFPSSQWDDHFPFVINVLRKNINHCLKSKTWFHASHCIMMNNFIALWLTLHYDEHFPMSDYDKHFPTSHYDEHFPMSHFDACFPSSQSDENFHFVVNVLRKNINHCLKSKTWFHTSHCD